MKLLVGSAASPNTHKKMRSVEWCSKNVLQADATSAAGGGNVGGGCTIQGGRAFFVKMLREIYPYNPSEKWGEDRWQSWRTRLGLS